MEINEKILEATAQYSFDKFLGAMEEAAQSDELDEYHTAVGFICDAVGYMKECGVEEEELIGHIRATYKAHKTEDELKVIEEIDIKNIEMKDAKN